VSIYRNKRKQPGKGSAEMTALDVLARGFGITPEQASEQLSTLAEKIKDLREVAATAAQNNAYRATVTAKELKKLGELVSNGVDRNRAFNSAMGLPLTNRPMPGSVRAAPADSSRTNEAAGKTMAEISADYWAKHRRHRHD